MPSKYVLNKQMNVASSSGGIRLPGGVDFKTVCLYVCVYILYIYMRALLRCSVHSLDAYNLMAF